MGFVRNTVGSITGSTQAGEAAEDAAATQAAALRQGLAEQERAFGQVAPGMAQFMLPTQRAGFGGALQGSQFAPQNLLGGGQLGGQNFQGAPVQNFGGGRFGGFGGSVDRSPVSGIDELRQRLGFAQKDGAMTPPPGQDFGGAPVQNFGDAGGAQQFSNVVDPLTQIRQFTGVLGPEAQQAAFQSFQDDPGTAFLREQGTRGINQNFAAQGGLGGGERLKALSQFNQGLANQQFNQRLGQLGGLAQQDIGLAQNLANLRMGLGQSQAQGLSDIGRATAGGQVAAGQAAQQGFGQLANLAGTAVGAAGAAGGFGNLFG